MLNARLLKTFTWSRGHHPEHQLINVGGASLRMHWNRGEAQNAIRSRGFDYVVLQEQSTLPVKNAARMRENVLLFDPVIRNSGAKTALYMTWARRHVPETQKAISDAYNSIGREIGATVVPLGVVWEKFLAKHKASALHDKDKSHPSLVGSYLAARVFFAVLFRESPVGIALDIEGLGTTDSLLLQRAARCL